MKQDYLLHPNYKIINYITTVSEVFWHVAFTTRYNDTSSIATFQLPAYECCHDEEIKL